MNRDTIIAVLKKHIYADPSANIVCDVGGFEEAADAIIAQISPETESAALAKRLSQIAKAAERIKDMKSIEGCTGEADFICRLVNDVLTAGLAQPSPSSPETVTAPGSIL
jgi:hypothetical protein